MPKLANYSLIVAFVFGLIAALLSDLTSLGGLTLFTSLVAFVAIIVAMFSTAIGA